MYLQNKLPSPSECGLDLMTCFQRIEYGKGEIVTLQLGKHHPNQAMKINTFRGVIRITEEHFTSVGFFPKTCISSLIV